MKKVFCVIIAIVAVHSAVFSQGRRNRPPAKVYEMETVGWDYTQSGHSLYEGEDFKLLWKNNSKEEHTVHIHYEFQNYLKQFIAKGGNGSFDIKPGEVNGYRVSVPTGLKTGTYLVDYKLEYSGKTKEKAFFFYYYKRKNTYVMINNLASC